MNPKNKEIPEDLDLSEIWDSILVEYHSKTNSKQLGVTIRNIKKKEGLRNKIITCRSAALAYILTDGKSEKAISALNAFGFKKINIDRVNQVILRSRSELRLLEKKQENENKDISINFWKIVANVEAALNYQLNIDKIMVDRWIELIKSLKERSKNKTNGKR